MEQRRRHCAGRVEQQLGQEEPQEERPEGDLLAAHRGIVDGDGQQPHDQRPEGKGSEEDAAQHSEAHTEDGAGNVIGVLVPAGVYKTHERRHEH